MTLIYRFAVISFSLFIGSAFLSAMAVHAQAVYEPLAPAGKTTDAAQNASAIPQSGSPASATAASGVVNVPLVPPVAGMASGVTQPDNAAPDAPGQGMDVQEPDEGDLQEAQPKGQAATAPVPAPIPTPAPAKPGENGDTQFSAVVLQGLNKVTARAETIIAPIGSVVRFGTIEIVAHTCWKAAPEDRPENAALLEISEVKQGEAPQQIFLGWMFSSSPGLSSLEHPFYDITVVQCSKTGGEDLEEEPPPVKQAVKAAKNPVRPKPN